MNLSVVIILAAIIIGFGVYTFQNKTILTIPSYKQTPNLSAGYQPIANITNQSTELNTITSQTKINSYLGVPCISNQYPKFTHDLTESDNILKITPNSLVANKSQDRAFLWIDTAKMDKVPIYAPVDADLVGGVYKISKNIDTIDYDLHFQVSCEVWFFINHISAPIEKIKSLFPDKPTTSTNNLTSVNPLMHFKAGELIGYTTGTAQAHNFDFAVFDLNHTNMFIGQGGSTDLRFKNFICPFDLFPEELKSRYYQKLEPQLVPESNCVA